jgi:outer membrane protein insertion porin family
LLGLHRRVQIGWLAVATTAAFLVVALLSPACTRAQLAPPVPVVSPELIGRPVEEVRVVGNAQVSSQVILNLVRTHEGDKFDPATVEEDYQRIYGLKRFSNVEAKVEPTRTGVVVIFQVTEQKLIKNIRFMNNAAIKNEDLEKAIDLHKGDAIEGFRISLAKRSITNLYKDKNHPFAHVDVDMDALTRTGDVYFNITEGPEVRIRKIDFIGNNTYPNYTLNNQIKTTRYYWIFNAGNYDAEQLEDDVGAVHRYYEENGFFEAKVGRKLILSPNKDEKKTEMQINFLIDEGIRYKVGRVSFTGNTSLTEAQLRQNLKLTEGEYFSSEVLQRDVKEIVKAYSPLGYIYDPNSKDPDYLRIGRPQNQFGPATLVFHATPGTVDLVYEIAEGKPFHIGRILVKGNSRSQDKLVLREMHVAPGQLYNSGEIADAVDRLKGSPYFDNATVTPIGDQPDSRDLLVEVHERQTANISVGAGISSNGGIQGNFTFEQHNFDATNWPATAKDTFSDRAFTGAGQLFRVTLEPGTQISNASILFSEPYIFDQPYSNTDEAYYRTFVREHWDEDRAGGRITFGKRFDYVWSTSIGFKGEDVNIRNIENFFPLDDRVAVISPVTGQPAVDPHTGELITRTRSPRAPDVLLYAGHNTLTTAQWQLRRDTTNHGPLAYKGSNAAFTYEYAGALGGDFFFNRFTFSYDAYQSLYSDLLDRRWVLGFHGNAGYITPDAPFFERFYGGGIGSIRGFAYRGVSPRDGRENDPIGGDFNLTGSMEFNYPIYGETLRGVVFSDAGTVEPDIHIHTIRASVGAGVRLVLPFFNGAPLALDFAIPISKAPEDETQFFSFSFGGNF